MEIYYAKTILKIAGGREVYFGDNGRYALQAGANGIISEDILPQEEISNRKI